MTTKAVICRMVSGVGVSVFKVPGEAGPEELRAFKQVRPGSGTEYYAVDSRTYELNREAINEAIRYWDTVTLDNLGVEQIGGAE